MWSASGAALIGVLWIVTVLVDSRFTTLDFNLPRCTNVILGPDQFQYSDTPGDVVVNIGLQPQTVHNVTVANDGTESITVCYPLSPQLLTCPVMHLSEYQLAANHTLQTTNGTRVLAHLGDYMIDSQNRAVVCIAPILPVGPEPRCNYITLQREEFEILANGSWRLKLSGDILNRPEFMIDTDDTQSVDQRSSFRVCWPLAIPFLNCPYKWLLEINNFQVQPSHRILFRSHRVVLGLGEYFMSDQMAVICRMTTKNSSSDSSIYAVYTGFYILSSVCLLLTVIYQMMAPKLTYHTRCLLCHVLSMLVMYIGLTVRKYVRDIPESFCYALYVITYTSAMAAFFWLNVLAFDVWQFFSGMQTSRFRMPITLCAQNRFICYSVYAWVTPVLLCILSVVVDRIRDLQVALGVYPAIAMMCWFNDRSAQWAFYYGPMVALMSFNLFYFVMTVLNLRFASDGTEIINRTRNKQLFIVCLKLFVVMGLSWLAEVFTWVITSDRDFNYYWYFSNIFTSLQGVAIFLVYTCKKENFNCLRQRFCPDSSKTRFSAFPEFSKTNVSFSESATSDVTSASTMSIPDAINKDKEGKREIKSLKEIDKLK